MIEACHQPGPGFAPLPAAAADLPVTEATSAGPATGLPGITPTTLPYPQDYDTVVDQAKRQQQQNFRPQLATHIDNLDTFSTIFIGYPNWWGTMPMALFTFFESHNLSGKKLIPFCSHEGSSLGRSVVDMQKLAPGATILEGLAIRGRSVDGRTTRTDIADWLAKLHVPMAQEQ